jgi:uncharacterized repeat protein (TIGR01451 family)
MKKLLPLLILALFGLSNVGFSQAVCGGTFTDTGGATINYDNNSDSTVTICPTNPGDVVTITFTSFTTEATYDGLYVYNGNSIASPQIASSNPAGNGPLSIPGAYWGTTIPESFTSSSPDGCLTFRFLSDGSVNNPGWVANVTCSPITDCFQPITLTTSAVTSSSIALGWTNTGVATAWQVLALPCGSPAPTITSTGWIETTSNPYVFTGLNPLTCYTFYNRSSCGPLMSDVSLWSGPRTATTLAAPPVCGGNFTDVAGATANYANNSNSTVTICPVTTGDYVTVNFTSFNVESNFDGLYVFDGNSIASPQIASTNAAGFGLLNLPGAFWGSTIPGPFTSSSPDGCLTFRFISDGSASFTGWIADVSCGPPPTCLKPTALFASAATSNSLSLGWTENSGATSWEVLTLPCGNLPTATSIGTITSSNPFLITGLNPGTCYSSFVRSICSPTDVSNWSSKFTIPTNDECLNAIVVPVNHISCTQITTATLNGATPSTPTLPSTCYGTANDDVWFQFVATDTKIISSIQLVVGSNANINQALYSGACGNLTLVNCSIGAEQGVAHNNLIVGETYYLRVFSNLITPQTVTFNLCVTTQPNCEEGQSICGVTNYANTTGITSLGTIGCLFTSPNPTYFSIKISNSGSVNMLLTQTTIGGTTPNLDVDYAAWGPFASQSEACAAISSGVPNLTGLTTGCSYSPSATENFNIANAIAGEYYIILITNFSNQAGFINVIVQPTSTGSIDCSGIRLNAFLDTNNNGTQEIGEQNFPLGQFQYEVNNDSNVHNITSPTGIYTLYDQLLANTYDLGYTINSDYNLMYSTTANFADVVVASGSLTTYNFPITILQNYNDLSVVIVPENAPRAGTTYKNKIVYTNNGNQALASGTLTFNNDPGTTITTISQAGTTSITNGFTYEFTNLLPFESRTITVTMTVPAIPTVFIGQLLANTASIIPPSGDAVVANNNSTSTQAIIAAYDPNDKTESHGDKIVFSSFTTNDYLYYTIRFENTGTVGALNVAINDVLDNQLDETTLVMIGASHSYTLDRLGNNLNWNFDNIQLPVSVANTDIGKGYINFKIKLKPGFAIGDIIPNTASIYFDTNPAIVTNTFNTEFVATLGIDNFESSNLIVFPNPANDSVQINLQNTSETIDAILINDILGKNIRSITNVSSNQNTIDVSNLSQGIYFVTITTENNLKLVKKLVIE